MYYNNTYYDDNFPDNFNGVDFRKNKGAFKEFERQALAFCRIDSDNPVGSQLFAYAWEEHHAYGIHEVVAGLQELAHIAISAYNSYTTIQAKYDLLEADYAQLEYDYNQLRAELVKLQSRVVV